MSYFTCKVRNISPSNEIIEQIAVLSQRESDEMGQIKLSIEQVSQVVHQNSAAASEEMSGQAQILQDPISHFKLYDDGGMRYQGARDDYENKHLAIGTRWCLRFTQNSNKQEVIKMEEKKVTRFWETEKELKKILLSINVQLELTHQLLSTKIPKLQELLLQFTELGTGLGFNMDSLDVKKFHDYIRSNELFQANDSLRNDMRMLKKTMTFGKKNSQKS